MNILVGAENTQFQGDINATQVTNIATQNNYHGVPLKGLDLLYRYTSRAAHLDARARRDPPRCMEGTREAIIQEILDWLKKVTKSSSILWLRGPTGHGKTALEFTIAEICKRDGVLIASFFFSNRIPNCSDGSLLFATLAAQLIQAFPWTKRYIDKAIREDPHIFGKALETQMKVLIAEPIQRIATMTRVVDAVTFGWMSYPTLIVIDGLDQCAGLDVQDEIIRIIGDLAQQLHLPLRFLIASRPEPNLCAAFEKLQSRLSKDSISTLLLTEDASTRRDIQIYLERKFNELRARHSYLPAEWPGLDVIMRLVDKASGQFVYAKTTIIYISSPDDRPDDRLDVILKMLDTPVGDVPYTPLDQSYLHIVRSVEHRREVLLILGQVILAKEMSNEEDILGSRSNSTSQKRIEVILNLRVGDVKRLLNSLHSVIDVGEDLKLLHASFEDFLLDPSRSKDFVVNLPEARTMLELAYIRPICTRSFEFFTDAESPKNFKPDLSHIDNTLRDILEHSHTSKHRGDPTDEPSAVVISAFRSPVEHARYGHSNLPIWLSNLARSPLRLFKLTRDLTYISSAISVQQWVVQLTPNSHPDMPLLLSSLGSSFSLRFGQTRDVSDLSEAVSAHQRVVQLTFDGHPDMPRRLDDLGNSFSQRFERTGNLEDISEAISAHQRAAQLTPDRHPDMPRRLDNLGNSFSQRFERTRDPKDISEAISAHQRVVQLTPDGHPDMPRRLGNIGNSFLRRFEQTGDPKDISEAVSAHQRVVQLTPDGHPDMPRRLDNIGNSFSRRFERTGDPEDISEAISTHQQAVQLTRNGHPDMPLLLTNLGNSFLQRFPQAGDPKDISEAISAHERAVQLTPNDHANMPGRVDGLRDVLVRCLEHAGNFLDVEIAIAIYCQCATVLTAPPSIRLRAALRWAELSASRNLHGYDAAICLLSQIAGMDQTFQQRYANLINTSHVTASAASAAFSRGAVQKALEWLEQGRCLAWDQLKQLRTPVDDLRVHDTSLSKQFLEVSRVLESSASLESPQESTTLTQTAIAAREWARLLDRIRGLRGFYNFLKPLPASTILKNLPQGGPVVLINVHHDRCDALALIPACDTPLHIPLAHFTLQQASKLRDLFKIYVSPLRRGLRGPGGPALSGFGNKEHINQEGEGHKRCKEEEGNGGNIHAKSPIHQILQELWLCVVKPVLDALRFSDKAPPSNPSRIWWCPTGPLAFLPIHAAGIYKLDSQLSRSCVSDFVVSSYTPTVGAILNKVKASGIEKSTSSKVLLISQTSTPDGHQTPGTTQEIKSVMKMVGTHSCIDLEGSAATVSRVKQEMGKCHWMHFACSGNRDVQNPLKSSLVLHDGQLELLDIMQVRIPQCNLAFLSACETTMGDERLPDEAIGSLLGGGRKH